MNNDYMLMETVDKMSDVKKKFQTMDRVHIEHLLKNLTEKEKDALLRLYIYENK